MRVLFVTHGVKDTTTAVYRNVLGRARFFQGLGHDAHVLTPADVGMGGHGRLLPVFFPFAVAWWILRRAPYDTISFHSHTGWVYQVLRGFISGHRGTPVAVTFHGLDVLYVRAMAEDARRHGLGQTARFRLLHQHVLPKLARWSCRRASRVFYMNARERQFLLEHGWTDERHARWMCNCLDASDFVSRRPTPGPVRLLMLAQWEPQKGTTYLVQAFTALVRKRLDVQLTCAGTRHAGDEVLRAFPEDVRGRVRVIPEATHEDVGQFYAAADVFVLSSIFEGFSIALLEAMAAGLAIVTTDAGAAPDILEAGCDAAIVPVADASALAAAMEGFVLDAERRREYGERARMRARAFTCDRILSRFAEDLLGGAVPVAARAMV